MGSGQEKDGSDGVLDRIKLEYLEAYEAGRAPSLEDYIARYPPFLDELVDYVLTLIELDGLIEREQRVRIRLQG